MEKFRVKSLSVSGPGKKIYRYGEVLTQENFNVPIADLVKSGFLEPYDESKDVSRETEEDPDLGLGTGLPVTPLTPVTPIPHVSPVVTGDQNTLGLRGDLGDAFGAKTDTADDAQPVKTFDDWTRKTLIEDLDKEGIEHDKNANKQELYDLWLASQKTK
jgi:hypothetical protein